MVRKDIQTHVSLAGIPKRLSHLKQGNLPRIVDWIETRNGYQSYVHCFTMIMLHCQGLLYNCTFEEMTTLIEVICKRSDMLERNDLIHRQLDQKKKKPAWYKQNSVFIRRGFNRGYRYEMFDTSQFFGRCPSPSHVSQRSFETMTVFHNKNNFLWTRNMQNVTVTRVMMDGFDLF